MSSQKVGGGGRVSRWPALQSAVDDGGGVCVVCVACRRFHRRVFPSPSRESGWQSQGEVLRGLGGICKQEGGQTGRIGAEQHSHWRQEEQLLLLRPVEPEVRVQAEVERPDRQAWYEWLWVYERTAEYNTTWS